MKLCEQLIFTYICNFFILTELWRRQFW